MILGVAKEIAMTFADIAPYMLLGLTFAGILHVFVDKDFVARHLGGHNAASVVKAALLGVPLPLCSCGVLPVAMSLRKGKASDAATISFLISTPQTGIDSIVATWGMLGPVYAIFRPIAALVMGIAGGLATIPFSPKPEHHHEHPKGQFSCNLCFEQVPHSHSFRYRAKRVFTYAFHDFLDDISVQLALGIVASGIIAFFLPSNFFEKYLGNEFLSMLVMVAVGIPMYICATASIPIAVALMLKGLSPGAAFVFLAVGSATNISFMLVIADVMGKKILGVYLTTLTLLSIGMGFALDAIFRLVGTQSLQGKLVLDYSERPGFWTIGFSTAFLLTLLVSLARIAGDKFGISARFGRPSKSDDSVARTITVGGMTCRTCGDHVAEELSKVKNVSGVTIDLRASTATITGNADLDDVRRAVERAGFEMRSQAE